MFENESCEKQLYEGEKDLKNLVPEEKFRKQLSL
uniref:Uncharacterized protein n=1 Tax=Lepeophtheirus salmonis TaxID=72036 RepID=A0A0K2TLZ7_LEPSM